MSSHSDLILAIDQGTTGTTCLLANAELQVQASANVEFSQHFPRPGWVEHDADEIWTSIVTAIERVLSDSGINPQRIKAIGITNQRETSLLWNRKDGRAIHRALVWQDRRTSEHCAQLKASGQESRVQALTGLRFDPYFSATKLKWTLDNVHGARDAANAGELAAGTIDTYVLWRLTGGAVHATEPSNACRTLLWPLQGGGWSEELCALFDVPKSVLPDVRPTVGVFGHTRGVPHLPDGIPIAGMAGDQQSALFGQACFSAGEAKCTYGTGAFIVLNTGKRIVTSQHGLLTSVAWELDGNTHGPEGGTTYCLEGSAFMAGAVVQWLRDGLGLFARASDIEPLARSVSSSDGVVLVPGHAGLGAPHWRPDARGLIRGLTRGTTRAHIARAALEGIALEIADLVVAMTADTGENLAVLKVDGGAAANDLLMQIQADLLGTWLERPASLEATALGAISLAALGVGLWPNTEAARQAWKAERTFEPQGDSDAIAALKAAWLEAIERA